MDYRIQRGGTLRGGCSVPGDKSISHRAVILGAIADGTTEIEGLLLGEDVLATVAAFRAMGVDIDLEMVGSDHSLDFYETVFLQHPELLTFEPLTWVLPLATLT